MSNIQLDYSDITDIFKEKLHVDNIVKKISSVFLNARYAEKINYKPYFQRNYVWDNEKATYFIESILLGTEIPPIVLFQTKDKNEVIDGRQRYETIERFLNDKLTLSEDGLRCLKTLAGKKYSQLSDTIKDQFEETRIRILQFRVVNEPKLDEDKEDKIKKEIFRRYNSGITPLNKAEIERALYINDAVTAYFYDKIDTDLNLLASLSKFFLPIRKEKAAHRDRVNILLMRIRTLLSMPFFPIYSYAQSGSQDIVRRYYYLKIGNCPPEETFCKFVSLIKLLVVVSSELEHLSHFLVSNKLFYEVVFWGFSVLQSRGITISNNNIAYFIKEIALNSQKESYWEHIIDNSAKDISMLFETTGSHYYSSIINRYNFIANILSTMFDVDFSSNLKDADSFKKIMSSDTDNEELKHYQLNKPLPETLTIEDIISDMQRNRFLVRPKYQRSEVTNIAKASYLMESILLGINIPPIFIYKRSDKIKEVVDGQQRILTILGFLGKTYKDENGKMVPSSKDQFKLSKLRILSALNGRDINSISEEFENRILEFPMDVIEIDYNNNPDFDQTDLFARLNSKPYPIKENTFEMWNAYVDKDVILRVREIANEYEHKIFKAKDTRMKVEELITSLAYLDYRLSQTGTELVHILNVYKKNDRLCSRIMSKETVTRTLSDISNKNPGTFMNSVNSVEIFAKKINCLIGEDPAKLKRLFSHSIKGTQFKTDQNFYFLWAILYHLTVDQISQNREAIFNDISNMFSQIQKTPEEYTPQSFFNNLITFPQKYAAPSIVH